MKKLFISSFLFLTFTVPIVSSAADKTVAVEWSVFNADSIRVENYLLYYSPTSDNRGTLLSCEPWQETGEIQTPPKTYSMTCSSVQVPGTIGYYTLVAQTSTGEVESNIFSRDSKLSQVKDFINLTPSANIPPVAAITATPTFGATPLTVNFDASNSSDSDGNIVSYTWDFGDGSSVETTTSPTPTHIFTDIGTYQASVYVTDDREGTSSPQSIEVSTSSPPPLIRAVNFQPVNLAVPDTFLMDSGEVYNSTRGYGWTSAQVETRDRDEAISPDQTYDTLIMVDPNGLWEVDLNNGNYLVTICVGDPYWPNTKNVISAEGVTIINDTIDDNNIWVEKSKAVMVNDGRLSLSFQGSTPYAKMCWIKIFAY